MNDVDKRLIQSAREIIKSRFKENYHHAGAALRTKTGKEYSAVHLEANVGRIAVCAEAIAIGMAAVDGDSDIEIIVAVDRLGNVISPCGMCRELISDYAPDAKVIVPSGQGEAIVPIAELLPIKYEGHPNR
ncbi:MAG: cytidine deaminase [Arenicellales bacterium]|nr:cytidine deaminase [Arenicellales bacterium]